MNEKENLLKEWAEAQEPFWEDEDPFLDFLDSIASKTEEARRERRKQDRIARGLIAAEVLFCVGVLGLVRLIESKYT